MMTDSQVLLSNGQPTTMDPDDDAIGVLLLACRMRRALKSKTRNRLWRNLKVYKKCFLHSHAIAWLMQCAAMDTEKEEDLASLEDSWSIQTDETFKCWMKKKFRSNSILEDEAVRLGNEMIRAGYVSHVANHHMFTTGQTKTLYFRFHNRTIDGDLKTMTSQGLNRSVSMKAIVDASIRSNMSTISTESEAGFHGSPTNEKLKDALIRLQEKTSRLMTSVETSIHTMNEANGRTAVLEAAVSSLTLGLIMVATGVLIYTITLEMRLLGLSHLILITNTMLCILAVWLFGESRRRKLEEHASILRSLAFASVRQNSIFPIPEEYQESESAISSLEKSSLEISEDEEPCQEQQDQEQRESIVAHLGREIKMRWSRTIKKSLHVLQPKPEGKQMRDVSTLPDPSAWPHRPVLLCVNTPVCPDLKVPLHGDGPCPLGVPFEFSSDLFEGSCLVRLRDIPSDDPASDACYFQGRKRRFQSVIQGRFKEELSVADVMTGHEFVRKLRRLPPNFVLSAATKLIGRLVPGGQIVLHSEQPQVLANLTASSQTVCADQPGNEPNITSNEFREDLSLLGGTFADRSMTSSHRKKHLSNPEKACRYKFDTETIYTFDFYQNLLDVGTYSLDLGFTNIGLAKSMDGQPIQVLSKTKDGRYLWSFQIWHEKLLSR